MTEKKTSYLLWLPCWWTTIPCKILDTIDSSFMVSEPLFMLFQQDQTLSTSQERIELREERKEQWLFNLKNTNLPNGLSINSMQTIGIDIRKYVNDSENYILWWVKETCNSRMTYIFDRLLKDEFDIRIYHFREPLSNYNSWKKKDRDPYYRDVESFIASYNKLYFHALGDDGWTITTHEEFCSDPLEITNRMLSNVLSIEKMPALQSKHPTKRWNKTAINSTTVKTADMWHELLTTNEISEIKKKLSRKYLELLSQDK